MFSVSSNTGPCSNEAERNQLESVGYDVNNRQRLAAVTTWPNWSNFYHACFSLIAAANSESVAAAR